MATRFEPARAAARRRCARPPTSRSPTVPRSSPRWGRARRRSRATSTPPTPARPSPRCAALGAEVESSAPATAPGGIDVRIGGVGLRGRPPRPRSTSATPARCCGCCRAGSRGSRGMALDGDESIRAPAGRPDRRAAARDGRDASSAATDGLPPLRDRGRRRCTRIELPAAGRQRPGEVLPAARRAARRRRDRVVEPAPTRDHTERMLRAAGPPSTRELRTALASAAPPARRHRGRAPPTPRARRDRGAGRLLLGRLLHRRRAARSRQRGRLDAGRHQPDPGRAARRSSKRMGAAVGVDRGGAGPAASPIGTIVARARGRCRGPGSAALRSRWRSTSCRWSPSLGCFAEGETVVAAPRSCATRSPTGSRPWPRGLGALGAEIEAREDGFAVDGHAAGCAAARSTRRATTASRCSARSPASRRRRGRGRGLRRRRGQLPGLRGRPGRVGVSPRAVPGDPRPATGRARAAGARPRWRAPRDARWGRRRPASRGPLHRLAPESSISMLPVTTTSHARSCT